MIGNTFYLGLEPSAFALQIICSSGPTRLVFKPGLQCFYLPSPPAILYSLPPMDSRHYHESNYPSSRDPGLLGPYVDYHPPDRYPYSPTYQTTPSDTMSMPSTQYAIGVWDIRDGLRQTSATLSMISPTGPTSPRVSEGGYSLGSIRPIGIYSAQRQVSPAVVSTVGVLA